MCARSWGAQEEGEPDGSRMQGEETGKDRGHL